MELELLVADAVGQRRTELEQLVRAHVDRELERLIPELVEQELTVRNGNGSAPPAPEPEPDEDAARTSAEVLNGEQTCTACGETKPLDAFQSRATSTGETRRGVCRDCDNQRRRNRRAPATRKPTAVMHANGRLVSPATIEHRREVVARGVDAGVEVRDGKTFRVTKLPDAVAHEPAPAPRIEPRHGGRTATAIA